MRAIISLFLLLLTGCEADEATLGLFSQLKISHLPNGLTVILVEDHRVPIVSYQTWVRTGSVDDPPSRSGMAHFMEHFMFKGTQKFEMGRFIQELERVGAEVNADTARDYTVFYENIPQSALPLVIELEADRLANIKIDKTKLALEKQIVLEEQSFKYQEDPSGQAQELLWPMAFALHPYRMPIMGNPSELVLITDAELEKFRKAHYQPGNVTLVVVGDFHHDDLLKQISTAYGSIPGLAPPERSFVAEPAQDSERQYRFNIPDVNERLALAYHITSASQDDSFALDILASILFEGTSALASRVLVQGSEIAWAVDGMAFTPAYPGLFLVTLTLRGKGNGPEAERIFSRLVNGISENGVSEKAVKAAKKQLQVQILDSLRTAKGIGHLIGTAQVILGDARKFIDDFKKYSKVTPADVQRVLRKYLDPNNRSTVFLLPDEVK